MVNDFALGYQILCIYEQVKQETAMELGISAYYGYLGDMPSAEHCALARYTKKKIAILFEVVCCEVSEREKRVLVKAMKKKARELIDGYVSRGSKNKHSRC